MRLAAVIVDNRQIKSLQNTIDKHMSFLEGWDLVHISDVDIKNGSDYNKLITSYAFWDNLHYDKILIFQHDSMILRAGAEDFLDYSYVGAPWEAKAPWNTKDRRGGNGGISIRDVKDHKTLVSQKLYDQNKHGNEDVFFSHYLHNVAPYNVCVNFSVETEYKLGTLAYHAIDKYLTKDQCHNIITQYD